MNALLFERPVWFATGPLVLEEEAQEMEDFIYHRPVLAAEVVELLAPRLGSLVVDGTCGGGGHAEAILRTGADVLALDQDPEAVQHVTEQLGGFDRRITVRLDELGIVTIGGALLDLGVSSRQLENAERGFSIMRNGPLDMRMDPRNELTAERVVGRHGRRHPATQVFQALRMEVNDELSALEEGLRVLTARLETGARIAVIAFHSLEDRIVKNFFRDHSREWLDQPEWPAPQRNPQYDLKLVTSKPVEPNEDEQRVNPRSRSAKLRVAEKI